MKKLFRDLRNNDVVKCCVFMLALCALAFVIVGLAQTISWGFTKIWPIDDDILASHDQTLEMVLQDPQKLYKLQNVRINVTEEQIELVFVDEQCDLNVSLDKEFTVISKEIVDNRFFADPINVMVCLVATPIAVVASFLILLLVFLSIGVVVQEVYQNVVKRNAKRKRKKGGYNG